MAPRLVSQRTAISGRRGNSIIEFTLLMPWYIFLFVGAFDFGFYIYALIATEHAARIGALYCAASDSAATDSATACSYALDQLRGLPNVGAGLTSCSAAPLIVQSSLIAGPDSANATSVQVTYTSPQLIPIPGLLPASVTITRTVVMELRS